jgi:DNA modification methylase
VDFSGVFTEEEQKSILDGLVKEPPEEHGSPQVDRAEELRQEWGTEVGQLWALGEHRLAVGDCTDRAVVEGVMGGERADMMFTDPPYGVGYTGGHFHSGDVSIKRERPKLVNDQNTKIYARFLPIIVPFVDGPCYVWFASSVGKPVYNAIIDNGCEIHAMIIWNKINAKYAAINAQYKQRHEPCMYFKPKGSTLRWCGPTDECTVWDEKRDPQNEYHPTQKPVILPTRALKNHKANLILDPFLGSGTTLIACENLNRRCRGIEIDPGYAAVTLQRFLDHTGVKPELIPNL